MKFNDKPNKSQFEILKSFLDVHMFDYKIVSDDFINRLHLYDENGYKYLSVIYGVGTYGVRWGLLEIQGLLTYEEEQQDSVLGFLTAKEVAKRIMRYWEMNDSQFESDTYE